MINEPYVDATPEQLRHPLVREFLSIHNMFRNELANILLYVQQLTAQEVSLDDPQTRFHVQAIIRSGSRYTQLLHFHHHAETDNMFPVLQQEGLEDAIVDKLNSDHDELGAMIDRFAAAIRDFAKVDPAVLTSDLRRLADALQAHLAYEEMHVCPLLTHFDRFPGY